MPLIKASLADSIGTVSFDRDAKRNALSAGLIAETIAALDDFKARQARAVVLRSPTAGKGLVGRTRYRGTAQGRRRIAASKESIRVLSESVPINPATFEYLHGLRRDVYFGPDYHEGTAAFLEKRRPKF